MKRAIKVVAALLLAATLMFTMAACERTPDERKSVTVVVDVSAYAEEAPEGYTDGVKVLTVKTDAEFLAELLDELVAANKLTLVTSETEHGLSLDGIDGVIVEGSFFFMSYSDDAENSNEEWGTFEYSGKTYDSNTVGISAMPVTDGCTYVFVYTGF